MKHYFTAILFLLFASINSVFAIHSFVNESKVWHCKKWKQGFSTQEDRYYYFQGDTVINGITAKKMYQKFNKESNNGNYQASLYEDGKKVYCCYPNQKDFNLIYDFGAKEGEKLVIDGMVYKVDELKEIFVNNQSLRVLYLSYTEGDEKYQFTLIQGFGGDSGPLSSGPKLPGSYENFINCEMDGKVVITSEDFLTKIGFTRTDNLSIQVVASTISCTSPTATKLEIYTMDAVKVGEATFANGEATVKVGKTPATYLYIVTYPNGRRESGKVAIGN